MNGHLQPRASNVSESSASPLSGGYWEVTPDDLTKLHDPKSLEELIKLGEIDGLINLLRTNAKKGLNGHDEGDLNDRLKQFGSNKIPQKPQKSFFRLAYEAMKDKVLILLSVAAVVSLALGIYESQQQYYDDEGKPLPRVDWVEGVAIIVAVIIVVVVGAGNDYQKERQFAKLNGKKEDRELIAIRNGSQVLVSIYDLHVGDIINVQTGDIIPADSVLLTGEVESDESSLTGESDALIKVPASDALKEFKELNNSDGNDSILDPFLISDAKILSGYGTALVTAVGNNSIHGRTIKSLHHEPEVTPLQSRLDGLAEGISKYGFLAALILFIVLFIRFCVEIAPGGRLHNQPSTQKGKGFVDILITSITIVVVAVPEGLPLAVTLALAFATIRMAQNGNLVRVLKSCETMGGATSICSDKTGTLTENKMRVVKGYFNSTDDFDDTEKSTIKHSQEVMSQLNEKIKSHFITNVVVNSTAFENVDFDEELYQKARLKPEKKNFIMLMLQKQDSDSKERALTQIAGEPYLGNKTESALLILGKKTLNLFAEKNLDEQRSEASGKVVQVIPFESSRKWSGIVIRVSNGYRLYYKGAAEIVFKNCGYQCNDQGESVAMERGSRDAVLEKIDGYANDALRAIANAHLDFPDVTTWPPRENADPDNPHEALPDTLVNTKNSYEASKKSVFDCLVGIQDPLKPGVAESVLRCKTAGVSVKMVTGDNLITAKAISKGCNILTSDDLSNEYAFMEGPDFRKLSLEEKLKVAPQLRVLARSSPEDKRILVDTLRKSGEVVAVTGDGTNDAPALKLADVGFSMGIAGTEVAREASDIILMTDDFNDIVEAIKWGRTVATSIKKFIQFQLTVNITACVLTFVSAVASSNNQSVLTAVQLLWVNLIMDTLAALALATDKPDEEFLKRKPAGRNTPLISTSMWKMILGQSTTQLIITFILHFAGQRLFYPGVDIDNHQEERLDAMTFNTFVWLQFFKLIVTRKLDEADEIQTVKGRVTMENLNFFQHLFRNWYFLGIALLIGGCQVLIMFVGGAAFSIARQTPGMWATAILCGFISLPVGVVIRIIPNIWVEKIFPTKAFNTFIYYAGFSFLKRKKKSEDLELGGPTVDEDHKNDN